MAVTESPKVVSTIGVKNVVIAEVISDTEAAIEYDDVQRVAGAIDIQVTPNNTDPDVQYADDVEFDVVYPDPDVTVAMEQSDLPLAIQAKVLDNKIDDNGVLIRTAGDKPPYFALGFKSEKADGTFRYIWLFKGRAAPITEQYHSKEGETITRQTGKIEWTFIKRTYDNQYQAIADEGQNGFTAAKGETFLESVYNPAFTPAP